MVKLILNKHGECPPDGFRFTDPDTGIVTASWDEGAWLKTIQKRRLDNGLQPIDRAIIYDQLCKLLPPGWCVYENGETPEWHIDTRLNVHDIVRGTKALISFISEGMPLVEKALAEERSLICSRCPFNIQISGCQPCAGLAALATTIGGGIKTPSDASLKSCAICHCSNKAQTRLPIDILEKSITPEMKARFESISHCWKRAEIAAVSSGT